MDNPRWMSRVLFAAAAYNLIWGAWVILRPKDLFVWTGAELPNYPSIWQCVGMIVGVYGIGYAVAAFNPVRHWPITLVGLLGKVLGPIGFGWMLASTAEGEPGRLPLSWGWTILTNDLIWWIPFAAVLYQAAKMSIAPKAAIKMKLSEANNAFKDQNGVSLADLSAGQTLLLVFLRHSGCTFCREALADLKRQQTAIEAKRIRVAVVHMGDELAGKSMMASYGLEAVSRISDPACSLYGAYELPRGVVSQLLGPSVWWRGFLAGVVNRHGVGTLGGDGFQMPGTFLVRDGKIIYAFRNKTAADRPNYCDIASRG